MLASTVQFSTYDQTPTRLHRQTRTSPREQRRYDRRSALTTDETVARSLRTQQRAYDPTPTIRTPVHAHPRRDMQYWEPATRAGRTGQCSTLEHCLRTPAAPRYWGTVTVRAQVWTTTRVWRPVLLRKEVIQPHLPVRLPCYDFVPIADPAFDGSLHKGWATGFGRYRLS
jgi:hypothetical protein